MTDITTIEHDPPPSPRDKERAIWLGFAIAAPPLLWTLQLLVLSAFSNYACFPGDVPLGTPPQSQYWVNGLVVAGDIAAIVITLASGWVSLHYHRLANERLRSHKDAASLWHLDRLWFMALGGLLSSGGFLVAILFETIASLMVRPC